MASGIAAPAALVSRFTSPLVVYVWGNGIVQHVISGYAYGSQTDPTHGGGSPVYYCGGSQAAASPGASMEARRRRQPLVEYTEF